MISVMEAVNNAIEYGNKEDASKQVHIRIEAGRGSLSAGFVTKGAGSI